MQDFRDLQVWQKAHLLVLDIYVLCQQLPDAERYGLTSQLRRAAVSIPANIAEGRGRHTDKDFAHFLQIALGSAFEVEYYIQLAFDLNYIEAQTHQTLTEAVNEVKKLLIRFLTTLRR
ncbi:MAG: four helix bundle protein [Chloroflexi bacterium]|nr:four helix bundle protein [Chloroflexota bacterium]